MSQRNILLTLMIHQYTRNEYYHKHDLYVAKQKKWLEGIRQESFDEMLKDRQTYYLDTWFWPPWRFNNIVGFAEVELETERVIIGHLYLPEGRVSSSKKKPLLLNFACADADFEPNDLSSLREAIVEVVNQMQALIEKHKWKLEFDEDYINHTDFLAMVRAKESKTTDEDE